jgi:hypothetical protein
MSLTSNNGKHITFDCPYCKKRSIRSDNFKGHFARHKQADASITDIESFVEYYSDCNLVITGSCIVELKVRNGKATYDHGACWDCHSLVKNPNAFSTDALTDHICKDKRPPPGPGQDAKDMWKDVGHNRMSVAQRQKWEYYDQYGGKPFDKLSCLWTWMLEQDRKTHGEVALPRGAPLPTESSIFKTLKEDDDLKDMFDFCDTEEELLETLLCKLKGIEAKEAIAAAKWNTLKAKYDALLAKHS